MYSCSCSEEGFEIWNWNIKWHLLCHDLATVWRMRAWFGCAIVVSCSANIVLYKLKLFLLFISWSLILYALYIFSLTTHPAALYFPTGHCYTKKPKSCRTALCLLNSLCWLSAPPWFICYSFVFDNSCCFSQYYRQIVVF